jgi:hypothetical protein
MILTLQRNPSAAGCILVGQDRGKAAIRRSRAAFAPLLAMIEAAQAKSEPVTIIIKDAVP